MALTARERRARRDVQLGLLRKIMTDPTGREYFYDLLASCHVYSTSFSPNALQMAFYEGERSIGIRIGADLTDASEELYLDMLKEAGNVRSQNQRSAERTAAESDDRDDAEPA